MSEEFEVTSELVGKIEEVLGRGLCQGKGDPSSRMCVEAAVCFAMGLPHGDNPPCVGGAVRGFKIVLNDAVWPSDISRSAGMGKIAIAQLGSVVLDQDEFTQRLVEKAIRVLLPQLFREVLPSEWLCLEAATRCEKRGSLLSASRAANIISSVYHRDQETDNSLSYGAVQNVHKAACGLGFGRPKVGYAVAKSAAYASLATRGSDGALNSKYLVLAADLCYEVLTEMDSPVAVWIRENNWQ